MKYISFFILTFFCCYLGGCDSTTENELNTIRTQVFEHYKGCRAVDYLKDYSEQFVNEFYTVQAEADSKAVDETEALRHWIISLNIIGIVCWKYIMMRFSI